jgi:hypothetical protein
MKVSEHWVRSPLLEVNRSCETCHPYGDQEIKARVENIQDRHFALLTRAGQAAVAMLDAVAVVRKRYDDAAMAPGVRPKLRPRRPPGCYCSRGAAELTAWVGRLLPASETQPVDASQQEGTCQDLMAGIIMIHMRHDTWGRSRCNQASSARRSLLCPSARSGANAPTTCERARHQACSRGGKCRYGVR